MNRFTKRYSDIIFHLLSNHKWWSLAELSEKTGYSKSTIWRDIIFLESILPEDWSVEKNETQGVRLHKPENGTLERVLAQIREKNTYLLTLRLILLNDGVDISRISSEVHISRSGAYRHLEKLQDVVNEAGVTLTASPFKLVGDERKIRRFIMQYIDFMSIESQNLQGPDEGGKVETALAELSQKYSISFRIGALHRLSLVLKISKLRISMGYYVAFPKNLLKIYEGSMYFELSKEMVPFMAKCPTREIQLQEILFFSMYLMSEERPLNKSDYLQFINNRMTTIQGFPFTSFLNHLSEYVGFNLSGDDNFVYYLFQTTKRIHFETEFETETVRTSMLQYLPYYESNSIFKKIEVLATEDFSSLPLKIKKLDVLEIYSLLQAAILRKWNQFTIQIALVSRTYDEKDYIREVLKFQFGSKLGISTVDPSTLELILNYEEFDLLISTDVGNTAVMIDHIPTIKVSAFPTPLELMEIKHFIEHQFFRNLGITPNDMAIW
jgi:biotin operon repressor